MKITVTLDCEIEGDYQHDRDQEEVINQINELIPGGLVLGDAKDPESPYIHINAFDVEILTEADQNLEESEEGDEE